MSSNIPWESSQLSVLYWDIGDIKNEDQSILLEKLNILLHLNNSQTDCLLTECHLNQDQWLEWPQARISDISSEGDVSSLF